MEQWELFDNGSGKVDGVRVRSFDVGSQTEGMVADDQLGYLYVGEEDVGIWRYGAEPTDPADNANRFLVDSTNGGAGGHLEPILKTPERPIYSKAMMPLKGFRDETTKNNKQI